MNEEEDNLSEEGLEDPYESALKKALADQKKRIEAQKDDLTEGKIKRKRTGEEDIEEEDGDSFLDPESGFRTTLAIGTEVGLNTILDLFSMDPTQISQVLGAQAINYLAQRIRGGEFSQGEMIASGLASLIPGAAQAKSISGGIARTALRGATAGAIETGAADLIDTGEIDAQNVLAGAGIGGAFGGIFGTAASQKEVKDAVAALQRRIRKGKYNPNDLAKFTEEELVEMGIGQPMESRFADELSPTSATSLQNELDTRAQAGTYGFKYSNVATKNRLNRFGIPNDVSSVYLNHAEAYRKAMGNETLEKFPTLIWNGKRYRPKSKGDYVYFEDYLDRRTRKKLGNDRRALRIWRQTRPGVKPGTFYREKLKQLRQLNTYEASLGLPESQRTRLRDADMDHKNALRSVEIYTEGLSEENTKLVYDLLERYDLFTGDDARNLILRNREIHRLLWPRMKAALKALNHKTIADFQNTKFPELEYLKYLGVDKNPKTGSTPLREYVETIKFIEEQAGDEALAALKQKVINLYQGKQTNVQTPLRDRLSEILGGEENLKAFIERLKREVPENIQPDLIEGEFNYIGSFGPLDPNEIADILNPPS